MVNNDDEPRRGRQLHAIETNSQPIALVLVDSQSREDDGVGGEGGS